MGRHNFVNTAFVLVGGQGTRLRSVFPDEPKPLVPLGGQPFLARLIDFLKREGIKKVSLLAGYKSERFDQFIRELNADDLEINLVVEDFPLGSAGAVGLAYKMMREKPESVVVVNGDTYFEGSLGELLKNDLNADYRVLLTRKDPADRYGLVEVGDKDRVIKFLEKKENSTGWVHSGFAVLSRNILQSLSSNRFSTLEKDVYPNFVGHGLKSSGQFFDYGLPQDYFDLNRDLWALDLRQKDGARFARLIHALEDCLDPMRPDQAHSGKQYLESIDSNLPQGLNLEFVNPTLSVKEDADAKIRPCLFLDRDGTIIEHIHYLKDPKQVVLMPGAAELMKAYARAGWRIVVVTNQSGIGREYFNWATYAQVHREMINQLAKLGVAVDWTFASAFYSESRRWGGLVQSAYRKPNPGIAQLAAAKLKIDLKNSVMVGDSHVDAGFALMAELRAGYWIKGNLDDLKKNPAEGRTGHSTKLILVDQISGVPVPK